MNVKNKKRRKATKKQDALNPFEKELPPLQGDYEESLLFRPVGGQGKGGENLLKRFKAELERLPSGDEFIQMFRQDAKGGGE